MHPAQHPTLQNLAALQHLRRGHRAMGPNLAKLAGQVAGFAGLDLATDLTGRVVNRVAGLVGFDPNNVPGLGGGGLQGGGGGGLQAGGPVTAAQKAQDIADAQNQVANAQAAFVAAVSANNDAIAAMIADPGNQDKVDAVQASADAMSHANDQLQLAQFNLSVAQNEQVIAPQGGGGGQVQPQPPQPNPPVVTPVAPPQGMSMTKKIGIALAIALAGYVAYENT